MSRLKIKRPTFDPDTGKAKFAHATHHQEMRHNGSSTNDAPTSVKQNLSDVTIMKQAMEAIDTIKYKPVF